jgi:hypothetical protein
VRGAVFGFDWYMKKQGTSAYEWITHANGIANWMAKWKFIARHPSGGGEEGKGIKRICALGCKGESELGGGNEM